MNSFRLISLLILSIGGVFLWRFAFEFDGKRSDLVPDAVELRIFGWRRARSLRRLWQSLLDADYRDIDAISLSFHVDAGYSRQVYDFLSTVKWPYGPMHVHIRHHQRMGLERLMLFQPPLTADYSVFLEDDVEVSPLYVNYIKVCIKLLRSIKGHLNIIGCSLYTPRVNEIREGDDPQHPSSWKPSSTIGSKQRFFLFQLPCSWGSLIDSSWWLKFTRYAQQRRTIQDFPVIPGLRSHMWKKSWKKYFIEFFFIHQLVLIYPSFPHEASFSTNHYEEGVHTVDQRSDEDIDSDSSGLVGNVTVQESLRSDKGWEDERFTVPLLDREYSVHVDRALNSLGKSDVDSLPLVNVFHEKVQSLDSAVRYQWLREIHSSFCMQSTPTYSSICDDISPYIATKTEF